MSHSISVLIINIILSSILISCSSTGIISDSISDADKDFLKPNPETEELFRVLIISDKYHFSQMKFNDKLSRTEDKEGDEKISNNLKMYDKIDEVTEGTLTISLYPDSGTLMKIRPKRLSPIAEINTLIVEDIKRWKFKFSSEIIEPNKFNIKFRVILRKIQSDEETMKEVMEKAKEKAEKKERKEKARRARLRAKSRNR